MIEYIGNHNKFICIIFAFFMIFIMGLSTHSLVFFNNHDNSPNSITYHEIHCNGFTNITVEEAWLMLTDTSPSNGVQIPIDVRRDNEWRTEHIDTPFPENPVHYPLSVLEDLNGLQEFISLYGGEEIILYCKSGTRSHNAARLLINSEFTGKIYNMNGGITAWKEAGYPTKANQPPGLPTITGPTEGKSGMEYPYTLLSIDPDNDNIFYCINWSDGTGEICHGPFPSGQTISLSHTWEEKGNYIIQVKAQDKYGDESEWETLEVTMPKQRDSLHHIIILHFQHFLDTCKEFFSWSTFS
jgi:rhodanese-related sulfurtransferase